MEDKTEAIRRELQAEINSSPVTAEKTWTTAELQAEFDVVGFAAPFVVVRRRVDGVKGSLAFKHSPRVYFDFRPEEPEA